MDVLSCTICEEEYGDHRHPRSLPCGHTFCGECINHVKETRSQCPECRSPFIIDIFDDFPVNYSLLRLARERATSPRASGDNRSLGLNAGDCPVHGSLRFFRCVKCSVWVCRHCMAMDHRQPPSGRCAIKRAKEATTEMREKSYEQINTAFAKIVTRTTSLRSEMALIQREIRERESNVMSLREELEREEKAIQALKLREQNVNKNFPHLKPLVEDLEMVKVQINSAITPTEMEDALNKAISFTDVLDKL